MINDRCGLMSLHLEHAPVKTSLPPGGRPLSPSFLKSLPFLQEGGRAELPSCGFRHLGWSGPWCAGVGSETT